MNIHRVNDPVMVGLIELLTQTFYRYVRTGVMLDEVNVDFSPGIIKPRQILLI